MRQNIHDPIETLAEDLLERKILANRILERLHDRQCPPALGIYGGWGTGKSSLLNLIKLANQNNSRVGIFIIDAWKYDGTNHLIIPVVKLLRDKAGSSIKDLTTWWEDTQRVLKVTSLATIDSLGKKVVGSGVKDFQSYYKESGPDSVMLEWEKLVDDIEEVSEAFRKLVTLALKEQKLDKLVLCIDNLDRCTPDHVVSLLESIKNFVGAQNCIWVFAMDSSVVASYINRKYDGTTMDGNSYLDKMVSEQYHLSLSPAEDGDRIIKLIHYATNGSTIIENAAQLPQIPKTLTPRRLIKSARKFSNSPNNAGESEQIIFAMILLYHTWPDFYERLSSLNLEHISAILAHFFKDKASEKWGDVSPLPLDESFTKNPELTYFLRHTFPTYRENQEEILWTIKNACDNLRNAGLP